MYHSPDPTWILALSLALLLSTGCTREDPPPLRLSVDTSDVQTQDLAQVLRETNGLDTLAASLERMELLDELQLDGPFTVFAPLNEAFAAAPRRIDSLLRARDDSTRMLLAHHLARGRYDSTRVGTDTLRLSTLAMQPVQLYRPAPQRPLFVNGLATRRTISAGNGIIYVIDSLLDLPASDSVASSAFQQDEQ